MRFSSPEVKRTQGRAPTLTDPLHYPQAATEPLRFRRALLLVLLTVLLPGSAQMLAGNRAFGRVVLRVTFTVWAVGLAIIGLAIFRRDLLLNWATDPMISFLIVTVLLALALGWALVFVNTIRVIRPPLLRPRNRLTALLALTLVMVLCSGGLGYAALLVMGGRQVAGIFSTGPAFPPVNGRYNFLLMGGDAGADRQGRRPDTIIVISVDATTGQAATISLPRNLQNAPFAPDSPLRSVYPRGYNCGDDCIINSLYTEVTQKYTALYPGKPDPGAQAMKDAASGVTGLTIQGYVLVDMEGFSQLIDALGGVKINAGGWVPMSGPALDNFGRHAPPMGWIAPGPQTLNGEQALWYARSREFVDDYARISRQQCIQGALLKQMNPTTVLTKFGDIIKAGTQMVETDIPQQQLGSFIDLALKSKGHPLARVTLGPPDFDKNFPTYPDFTVAQQRVKDLLNPPPVSNSSSHSPDDAAAQDGGQPGANPPPPAGGGQGTEGQAPPAPPEPGITADYLQRLARAGNTAELVRLLANNGQCTPQ